MASTIQLRRGSLAAWQAADPVLADGEFGVQTADDLLGLNARVKVGNGVDTWSDLPYVDADARSIIGDALVAGPNVTITDNGDGTYTIGSGGGGTNSYALEPIQSVAFPFDSNDKVRFIAGILRQNTTTRSEWAYLDDSGHTALGALGATETASTATLPMRWASPSGKKVSFFAGCDEGTVNQGLMVGGSLTTQAAWQASMHIEEQARVWYDGTAWQVEHSRSSLARHMTFGTPTWSGATRLLTVPTAFCVRELVSVAPVCLTPASDTPPFIPVVRFQTGGVPNLPNVQIAFIDPTTWTYASSLSTRMDFMLRKGGRGAINLDGAGVTGYQFAATDNIQVLAIFHDEIA